MRISEGSLSRAPESMTASCGSFDDDSSSMMVSLDSLPPATSIPIEECLYRGEGNANLVVSLPKERKVIRFRKSLPEEVSLDGGKQRIQREREFAKNVVSCFFGSYAQIPEIIYCDRKDIVRLTEAMRPHRPDKRRQKEISEVYATKLLDYTFLRVKPEPELVRNKSTFCLEIKPKQGYLPKEEYHFQKCPYCLTQYYKLKKGTINTRSTYCPLDLFSGEEDRMDLALKSLLNSPQNNLKIFKDGILVYDQNSSSDDLDYVLTDWFKNSSDSSKDALIERFSQLIRKTLLSPFAQEQSESVAKFNYDCLKTQKHQKTIINNSEIVTKAKKILYFAGKECNSRGEKLPKDCVLERILLMQRLPYISAEHVYHTYAKFSSVLTDELIYSNLIGSHKGRQLQCYEQVNPFSINDESVKKQIKSSTKSGSLSERSKLEDDMNGNGRKNESTKSKSQRSMEQSENNSSKSSVILVDDHVDSNERSKALISIENVLALQNYLLFSTARDCSILMAFQELNPNAAFSQFRDRVIKVSEEQYFLCDIGVSDLDPKSFHCIEKHRQRDINVLNAVISVLEEELAMKNRSLLDKRLSQ